MLKIATLAAAIGLVVLNVNAAGFDCTKASTSVEKQICANPEISDLDSKLSDVYRKIAGYEGVKQAQGIGSATLETRLLETMRS